MKKLIGLIIIVIIIINCTNCTTYYIPIESFKEQFKDNDPAKLNVAYVRDPLGLVSSYLTNSIDSIECVDKNNNPKKFKKKPSHEMRITQNNNKKTILYLDQVFFREDSLICGNTSYFLNTNECLNINNVKKIEFQDGHKKFKYINPKDSDKTDLLLLLPFTK
ncbi:hypothetical protein [Dysgonomonas sp. ZJ709]|uniref:hypothetical protein n=1 Tax=Dysgonomonas sp. ZJ709 TaxID=2709797 RepID=UPI0013EB4074|nr:hypothetical protein [Dysgonomonas sp. ZJ709]